MRHLLPLLAIGNVQVKERFRMVKCSGRRPGEGKGVREGDAERGDASEDATFLRISRGGSRLSADGEEDPEPPDGEGLGGWAFVLLWGGAGSEAGSES